MARPQSVILIVDDTPENLRVLGELLEADGHEVRVATNGPHGLEIARSSAVDLVLLDIMMPGMDGYEVCTQLKGNPATRDIPVMFLTALDSPGDEARGLKLGAVDYISKPFQLDLVRARVANHLALHLARQQLRRHNEELEALVAERTQDLANAHRRLLTLDSAKYDFLQIIYQKLWAPGSGIIDLSRTTLAAADPARIPPDLRHRYEQSQSDLFETINNALLVAGSHPGDKTPEPHPVRLDVVLTDACDKWQAVAQQKRVRFEGDLAAQGVAAGDLDLVYQVLATAVHAALLMAQPQSTVVFQPVTDVGRVGIAIAVTAQGTAEADWGTLFQESARFHASEVGQTLGLAIPLAVKLTRTLGGTLTVRGEDTRWTITFSLPAFVKKSGVRISL
jgi:CheY-like chemotaxis protein